MSAPFTDDQLQRIAHGLGHYNRSHGNLPLFKLTVYSCDDEATWISEVGYRDVRAVFEELAELRAEKQRLRAEVEALRDDYVKADNARVRAGLGMSTQLNCYEDAYNTVLDLIDKHAREGQ